MVNGYNRTYQPAQKNAIGKAIIRMINHNMNHKGFFILKIKFSQKNYAVVVPVKNNVAVKVSDTFQFFLFRLF